MIRRSSVDFTLFSIFLDTSLVVISLALATLIRPLLNSLPRVKEIFGVQDFPHSLYLVFPLVWVSILLIFSIYNHSRNLRFIDELATLLLGSLMAGVALAGVLYFSFRDFSRALFLCFFIFTLSSTMGWRILLQLVFHLSGYHITRQHRALIVGAGIVGRDLQKKFGEHRDIHFSLVGFLDDDPQKRATDPLVLDNLDNVRKVVLANRVDHIILALPRRAHERTNRLVADLHDLPVKVYVIPDYFALTLHHAAIEEFAGIPVLDLRAPALNDYQRVIKRAFDIIVTLLLMPFLLPLMGLLALAIRIDSPGPVLIHQDRAGENGHPFKMHKFRTMVENAESLRHLVESRDENGHLIHKTSSDQRVTRLGGFLRKRSLDEFPQFFNILKGEMSLVGPRPEMLYLVEKYEPWQRKRFAVPQGLTGWWQVHGRSDKPMHLHTEEDLYYIQHYSPWLDLMILFQTIGAVLSRRGAY